MSFSRSISFSSDPKKEKSSSSSSAPKKEKSSSSSSAPKRKKSSSSSSAPKKQEPSSDSNEPKIMVSTSTSSIQTSFKYDVFISFRGEDTRKNFVDHLYTALDQAGIYTFKDDQKLQRGKSISPELLKAVEESMVAVVVFSTNYANSSWCLDELVKIVECQHLGQMVLPVFYDVDPADVRGQKRSFHEAFEQHELNSTHNMDKVKKWREASKTTANLAGWHVPQIANGHEAESIKQIVQRVRVLSNEFLPAENLIGMESRVRAVNVGIEYNQET